MIETVRTHLQGLLAEMNEAAKDHAASAARARRDRSSEGERDRLRYEAMAQEVGHWRARLLNVGNAILAEPALAAGPREGGDADAAPGEAGQSGTADRQGNARLPPSPPSSPGAQTHD